jgi:hypothetical protein
LGPDFKNQKIKDERMKLLEDGELDERIVTIGKNT